MLDLKAVQPYIAQYTSMTLISGRLSGDAKVRYGANKPALQVAGNISVAGLHTIDNALHDDFINWDRVDVSGITFQHDPDRLDIQQVTARKLYARVIIEPDTELECEASVDRPGRDGRRAGRSRQRTRDGDGAASRGTAPADCASRRQRQAASSKGVQPRRPEQAAPPAPARADADGHQENRVACRASQLCGFIGAAELRHGHSEHRGNGARSVFEGRIRARKWTYTVPWTPFLPWPSPATSIC